MVLGLAFACSVAAQAPHGSLNNSTFVQPGTGAVSRSAEAKAREVVSVQDFGADPYHIRDSLPAFNAAKAAAGSPGRIYVPMGNYVFTTGGFAMDQSDLHLTCDEGATITYTGSGTIADVILMGNYTGNYDATFYANQSVEGCTIIGNSHVTTSLIHGSNSESGRWSRVNLKNSPHACAVYDYSNTIEISHVLCTQTNGQMTISPVIGLAIDHMNNVQINSSSWEGLCNGISFQANRCAIGQWSAGTVLAKTGTTPHGLSTGSLITISGASPSGYNVVSVSATVIDPYTFSYPLASNPGNPISFVLGTPILTRLSDGHTFPLVTGLPTATGIAITSGAVITAQDGTSEGNNFGVTADTLSASIKISSMDNESNINADVESAACFTRVLGGWQTYYVHLLAPGGPGCNGQLTVIDGVVTGQITIDAGVIGAVVINNDFGNNFNNGFTITDNGTQTTLLNNRNANGGGFFENKFAGIRASSDWSGVGIGAPPPVVGDDPNGYISAANFGTDFIRFGTVSHTLPTCDATHGHGALWMFNQTSGAGNPQLGICMFNAAGTTWAMQSIWYDRPAAGLTPGTYGDANHVGQLVIDATGNVSSATNVAITTGSGFTGAKVVTTCTTPATPSGCTNVTNIYVNGSLQ